VKTQDGNILDEETPSVPVLSPSNQKIPSLAPTVPSQENPTQMSPSLSEETAPEVYPSPSVPLQGEAKMCTDLSVAVSSQENPTQMSPRPREETAPNVCPSPSVPLHGKAKMSPDLSVATQVTSNTELSPSQSVETAPIVYPSPSVPLQDQAKMCPGLSVATQATPNTELSMNVPSRQKTPSVATKTSPPYPRLSVATKTSNCETSISTSSAVTPPDHPQPSPTLSVQDHSKRRTQSMPRKSVKDIMKTFTDRKKKENMQDKINLEQKKSQTRRKFKTWTELENDGMGKIKVIKVYDFGVVKTTRKPKKIKIKNPENIKIKKKIKGDPEKSGIVENKVAILE
jgi:hypothetical protein